MKRFTPLLSNSEKSLFGEIFVENNQEVEWIRDIKNDVIGYNIINPKPDSILKHIVNDGRLLKLDILVCD